MSTPGLEQQLNKMTAPLERIYRRKVIEMAPSVAWDCMEMLTSDYDYHDVTGNTTTGWFIGFYVRGELVYSLTSEEFLSSEPTRKTLRKGEKYDLPYYWGGDEVDDPYVGETGKYNYYAYKRAAKYVKSHKIKYKRKNRLAVFVGNATEYSAYNSSVAQKLTEVQMFLGQQGFANNLNSEIPF